jgi:predicted nucleotidyltransferase
MHPLITDNLAAIRDLAREFGVARVDVFGSVTTDDFDPTTSDIDFLDNFGPWDARLNQLRRALADLLGREVDLVEARALRKPWFAAEAGLTRQVIYDATTVAQPAS